MSTKALIIAILGFSLNSFAAKSTAKPASSAMASCKVIVQTAIDKDYEGIKNLSLMPAHAKDKKLSKKGFNKMHDDYMTELKDLNCLREMTSDDHAVVEAESDGKKRLIPFVKTTEGWKFDSGAYMAFYDVKKMKKK